MECEHIIILFGSVRILILMHQNSVKYLGQFKSSTKNCTYKFNREFLLNTNKINLNLNLIKIKIN